MEKFFFLISMKWLIGSFTFQRCYIFRKVKWIELSYRKVLNAFQLTYFKWIEVFFCLSTDLVCLTQIWTRSREEVQHEREVSKIKHRSKQNFTTKLILWLFNVSKLFDVCSSSSEYGTERCKFEVSLFAATTEKPHHMWAIWSYESIVNIPAHVVWLNSDSWGKNVNRRNKISKCLWWSWLLQSFSCDNSQSLCK